MAAVLFADMVGYSFLQERVAVRLREEMLTLTREGLSRHRGWLVKIIGDGFLAEFPSASEAIAFAIGFQEDVARRNAAVAKSERFRMRVGLHVGDIQVDEDDIQGTTVVIAARTEPLAAAGGISMTEQAWQQVQEELPRKASRLGRLHVKGLRRGLCFYHLYASGVGLAGRLWHRARLFFNWPGRVPAGLVAAGGLMALALWLRPLAQPLLDYFSPPDSATLVNRAGRELERFDLEGHLGKAISLLQRAIERGGSQVPPPDWLAQGRACLAYAHWRSYLETGAPADRQEAASQSAAATNGLSPLAYQVQGLVALEQTNFTEAVRLLTRANELSKGQDCDILVNLAEAQRRLGRAGEAALSLSSAYAVVNKPWHAYVSLGRYEYLYNTNLLTAQTNFEQALRMAPDSPSAWIGFAGAMVNADKPAEALKAVDAVAHNIPQLLRNPEFCSSKGTAYLARGDALAAARWFLAAADLRLSDYRFWRNAGIALHDITNRQAEARDCFAKALRILDLSRSDNPNPVLLADTGLCHAGLGQSNEAVTAIGGALRQSGDNQQVRNSAGEALSLLGIEDSGIEGSLETLTRAKAFTVPEATNQPREAESAGPKESTNNAAPHP